MTSLSPKKNNENFGLSSNQKYLTVRNLSTDIAKPLRAEDQQVLINGLLGLQKPSEDAFSDPILEEALAIMDPEDSAAYSELKAEVRAAREAKKQFKAKEAAEELIRDGDKDAAPLLPEAEPPEESHLRDPIRRRKHTSAS